MSRQPANVLVLVGAPRRSSAIGTRLTAALATSPQLRVEVSDDPETLCRLAGRNVVVVHREEPLHPEQAEALVRFLQEGGRVVSVGDTLWHWRDHTGLCEIEWSSEGRTQQSELRVRRADGCALTDRLPDEFAVCSSLRPLAQGPRGAQLLLSVSWRFTNQVVAFRLPVGRGALTNIGLDGDQVATTDAAARFLVRWVRLAAGAVRTATLGVGLLGYGAIARAHAEAIQAVAGLSLRGVVDPSPRRREAAQRELDVAAHDGAAALLDDPDVDVVVIGTPPNTHVACTLEALDAGKHVVCEKPLALTLSDADAMIARADANDRALTVYQNRRWDPDFVALRDVVRSGAIGSVFHIEAFVGGHGHPCNYWHSHEAVSGGTLFDWGSHYVDQILQLLDAPVVSITAHAQKRLWHDVTNADQVRLEMRFQDGAEASFIHSDIAAARKPKWYVLGTAGALVGDWQAPVLSERDWAGEMIESQLPPADAPARLVVHRPDGRGGAHRESLSLPPRDRLAFYRNLADHLLTDEPLAVGRDDMRRVIAVLDAATQSIATGGAQVPVGL
ncbi:MAG: hypothetical protein NVSMB29_17530 [Candidatus Dormibacteria bacterium]